MSDNDIPKDIVSAKKRESSPGIDDLVLDKSIFSNVFEKDIRRIYLYKKAERIAKALHLVAPAFRESRSLRDRLEKIAMGMIDASVLPPTETREALSRELLTLSSVLALARAGGHLSPMNADIINREAHNLLQEIASYEEPRVHLDEAPSLATLAKSATRFEFKAAEITPTRPFIQPKVAAEDKGQSKGHVSDNEGKKSRREAILSLLKSKGPSYIKDLSTLIRNVSEKTIQRELQALVLEGSVVKEGERRWTTYSLSA